MEKTRRYEVRKFGKYRERRDYSSVKLNAELPGLIDIQLNSFDNFIKTGIKELFDYISPIENTNHDIQIYFGDYVLEKPEIDIREAKRREVNYASKLKVKVKLVFLDPDGSGEVKEIKEEEIYLGDLPIMCDDASFIINGASRVIMTQIVRSAGVYFTKQYDKKRNDNIFEGQIIPTRGLWLEYEIKSKDELYIKVDRSKKLELTVIPKAFGFETTKELIDLFGDSYYLRETLAKDRIESTNEALVTVFEAIRNGEQATPDGAKETIASRFFDSKRYDLAPVGRYKLNKKLDIFERIEGLELAQDVLDQDKKVFMKKGTVLVKDNLEKLKANRQLLQKELNPSQTWSDQLILVESCDVYPSDPTGLKEKKAVRVVGNNQSEDSVCITISDILASSSYYINLYQGVGYDMVIDHLENRRLNTIGDLLSNQFRIGLTKIERRIKDNLSTKERSEMKPSNIVETKQFASTIKEFFTSSQLSQFMAQTNPLDELTNKRRITALGPNGLSRDRASFEVRDVHYSHYGRICPIETPEGPNIGLITSLALYAKVNKYGFIQTPYYKVNKVNDDYIIDDSKMIYLTADEEKNKIIAEANSKMDNKKLIGENGKAVCRLNGDTLEFPLEQVDLIDVSPKQIISVSTSCIPFLEHDDTTRALMGSNMQRQSVPLIKAEAPYVGTGVEYYAAKSSGSALLAKEDGIVKYVDGKKVIVQSISGDKEYDLVKFERSNNSTCLNNRPIVKVGEKVSKGDILADGYSMDKGELALGKNAVVAFMTWNGYNYEDAVIMSERMVKEDVYTSIHIEDYFCEVRDTKNGKEELTRDIPGADNESLRLLDERGIVRIGAEVKTGQILVGKITPKTNNDLSAAERLLHSIFQDKSKEIKDTSLRVPNGGGGIVERIEYFNAKDGDELANGVNELVKVYIVQKRKISEGDKMAGRHGNKGVISIILPEEDMPYMEDGTPVDILLNPLGVPSRMNIGQVLEIHLGMAAKRLGIHVATPVFDGVSRDDLSAIMKEAGMAPDGKQVLYDGRTGEKFDNRISVGVMYMIKLTHMVDDKLHARAVGKYILVTQQPMGGKANDGGQRFGEMEVWALEAYGAAYTLQEMLTVKSDDIIGRNKVFKAITNGTSIPEGGVPESFRVLIKELQALAIDVKLITVDGKDEANRSLVQMEAEEKKKKDDLILSEESDDQIESQEEVVVNATGNDDITVTEVEDFIEDDKEPLE